MVAVDAPQFSAVARLTFSAEHWRDLAGALRAKAGGYDVLACPNCGGRFRLVALIEHHETVQRILRHLGLPAEVPPPRPARAPPRRPSAWDVAS